MIETGGQRTAYVLFDGNNMVPGIRDEIRLRLAGSRRYSRDLGRGAYRRVGARRYARDLGEDRKAVRERSRRAPAPRARSRTDGAGPRASLLPIPDEPRAGLPSYGGAPDRRGFEACGPPGLFFRSGSGWE